MVCAFLINFMFVLSPEAQAQGNGWLAHGLSASIEHALGPDAQTLLEQNCLLPTGGFAPAPVCVFVRGTSGGPNCMRWDEENGRCQVVVLRAGLLNDTRVVSVIEEASREYCHYIGPDRTWETVPGCHSPGADWRQHVRNAPNTICVVVSERDTYRLAFAIRDGIRIRDRWCENTWVLTRT
jgi:hypothetical protein